MREKITTVAEMLGATLISVGVGIVFSWGISLIVAGLLVIAGSYLAAE
jgi:hypothetical protein